MVVEEVGNKGWPRTLKKGLSAFAELFCLSKVMVFWQVYCQSRPSRDLLRSRHNAGVPSSDADGERGRFALSLARESTRVAAVIRPWVDGFGLFSPYRACLPNVLGNRPLPVVWPKVPGAGG